MVIDNPTLMTRLESKLHDAQWPPKRPNLTSLVFCRCPELNKTKEVNFGHFGGHVHQKGQI
jgi:hypothetical protein